MIPLGYLHVESAEALRGIVLEVGLQNFNIAEFATNVVTCISRGGFCDRLATFPARNVTMCRQVRQSLQQRMTNDSTCFASTNETFR